MPQVLKEEVFDRIFQAGIDVFYEKVYYKLLLLANPLFYGNRKIFVIIMLKLLHFHI